MAMPIMKDGTVSGFRRITGKSSKHPGRELDAFIDAQNKQFSGRQASSLSEQERKQIIGGVFGLGVKGTVSSSPAPTPQQKSLGTTGGITSNQASTTKKRRSILAGGVSGGGATILGRSTS